MTPRAPRPPVTRWRLFGRSLVRFAAEPISVRNAMRVIVVAFVSTVAVSGTLMWLLDRHEFPDVGVGLWWALQTVTTVGYGDIAPRETLGRLVGGALMLTSIAFVSIVTAAITSSFVERTRQERHVGDPAAEPTPAAVAATLGQIAERLERIEQALSTAEGTVERGLPHERRPPPPVTGPGPPR